MTRPFQSHFARKFTPRPSWNRQVTRVVNGKAVPAWLAKELRERDAGG